MAGLNNTPAELSKLYTEAIARAEKAEADREIDEALADSVIADLRAELAETRARATRMERGTYAAQAELKQLHAQHASGPALHARRRLDGSIVHGDLDWCRYDAAQFGGEVVVADTCGYLSPWRPVDDAPATAFSATGTASETTQVLADDRTDVRAAPEPTEAGPYIRPAYCRCAPLPEGPGDRDANVWCWQPNPNGPLRCGLLAGHDGDHQRGERRWT